MTPDSPPPPVARPRSWGERLFGAAVQAAGVFVLALAALLVVVLVADAFPVLSRAGEYQLFTSTAWTPKPVPTAADPHPRPTFGALTFVYGTAVTSLGAVLLAVPLGVAAATFLAEVAGPRVRTVGRFLVELSAAIPSVVYGFWGLVALAPAVQKLFTLVGGPNTGGNGLFTASVVLAVMILPYITAISYEVCRAVPRSQREGALALGATHWQTIRTIVWPYARPGMAAAAFLALGRALGETMAVTMLVGNQAVIGLSPFALGDTIASRIATQLHEADEPEFRAALVALALVLLAVTAAFNVAARRLLNRLTRDGDGGPRVASSPASVPAELTPPDGTRLRPTPADGALPVLPRPAVGAGWAGVWNRVAIGTFAAGFALAVVPLFLILGDITVRGAVALEPGLFTERARLPMTNRTYAEYRHARAAGTELPKDDLDRPVRRGGLGHAMLGSVMIVSAATVFAVPVGLLTAVYLAETRRSRRADAVRFVAELLGGVPSVVVGIFGYAMFVYPVWLGGRAWGYSGLAGALTLAVIMLPVVIRSAEESMKLVPEALRQASYALGATRFQTLWRVVLPAALPAVVTGVFLAVGRIAGETAPLLLTAGHTDAWPTSLWGQTPYLPHAIFQYSSGPFKDEQDQAWAATLVLLGFVMLLNVGTRLLAGKPNRPDGD